jgi:beta-glucosidase
MAGTFELPDDFRFGVATAGFQVEGGYNGPGEPANNWAAWERAGRAEVSGIACNFWNRYEEHLDLAAATGCNAFRLSVEWARVEPREGEIDTTALERYAAILDACTERGLEPMVTLHHFTHPEWLGEDFWLRTDAPERFAAWAELVARHLGGRCRTWVTLNEINVWPLATYLLGAFPPGRIGATGPMVRALDHMLCAHVLAYGALHTARPDAIVGTNNYCMSAYELDRLLTDVLLARSHGVGRHDLGAWLAERRRLFYEDLGPGGLRERAARRFAAAAIRLDQALPRAVAAVYASPHACTLDTIQIDYYAPDLGGHVRLPGHRTAGGRNWRPARALWDDPVEPAGLTHWARRCAEPDLPLWVVENGLCNRVVRGRSYPRRDGWTRVGYLTAHLGALVDAIDAGVPVGAYFHWTLLDNYEWGSYEPRFGLYGVDRERGARVLPTDSMGADAAGAYRRIIEGLRAGDRSVVGR